MSLLISITFVVYLMPKLRRCFFRTKCFYISYSIIFFPFTRVDWFLNRLFSNDRSVWSFFFKKYEEYMVLYLLNHLHVKTNHKDPYCPWKYLFLWVFLFWYRPWFICCVNCVSSLSRPWFEYYFNCVSFIAFGCINSFIWCLWFLCFFYCFNILFCWNMRSDGLIHHSRFCFPVFVNPVSSPLLDNHVNNSDQRLFDTIQIPTCFSNLLTWIIRFIRQWANGIVWHDFSALFSPPC